MKIIDVPKMLDLVQRVGVRRFLVGLTAAIEEDFRRWPEFEKSPRVASHVPGGVIELMPTTDGKLYSFKFVNGHPANTASGKLTVTAFGAIADTCSGYPLLICEMTFLTALRTAATSALACKYLARKDCHTMAMIGTGAQAEFQALAFQAVNGVHRIQYFDRDPAAMRKFAANLTSISDLELVPKTSVTAAVEAANVVTTATACKTRVSVLTDEMVRPGMHLNAIGGDCPGKTELAAEILRRARIVVEYTPQTRMEGEIQALETTFPVAELWEIVAGRIPGRHNESEITVFDSVGFAIEDFAALRYVLGLLEEFSLDARADFVPDLSDPKDLYALVRTRAEKVM